MQQEEDYKNKLINIFLNASDDFCKDRIRVWQQLHNDLSLWLEVIKAAFAKHDGKCESLIKAMDDTQIFKFSEALKDVELDIAVNRSLGEAGLI